MDLQSICQTVFISLIIIFLCHYFFYYLQASFTEPKVKDMINHDKELARKDALLIKEGFNLSLPNE